MSDSDYEIKKALRGVADIASTNFPGDTDVTVSANGKSTASVKIPYMALVGLLELAEAGKSAAIVHKD